MGELQMFDDFGLRNDIESNNEDLLDDLAVDFDSEDEDLNISEETDETTLLD